MYNTLAVMNAMPNLTPYLEWTAVQVDSRGKATDCPADRHKNVEPSLTASDLTVSQHVNVSPIVKTLKGQHRSAALT